MSLEHEDQKHRRRNYYIDRDFQTKFILQFSALVAVGAGLMIIVLYLLSQGTTSVVFINARVRVMTTADLILPLLINTILIVTGFVSIGAVAVTLFVSHRIAGPLYRFRQVFKELSAGNFSHEVHLRQGDQLVSMGEDFNRMIVSVRARLFEVKSMVAGVKAEASAGGLISEGAARQRLVDLQHKVEALEKTLEFFKT
jgi:methyl-accepting chemotaxis protein